MESEREVLSAELAQSRQRVDFFVGLLARFWNFSPLDVKAPDGRTFQFVDPDPHRTLRVIKEAMAEALADSQVAARAAAEPGDGLQHDKCHEDTGPVRAGHSVKSAPEPGASQLVNCPRCDLSFVVQNGQAVDVIEGAPRGIQGTDCPYECPHCYPSKKSGDGL